MELIKWCKKQKNGLEIITPNKNLRKSYTIKAEEALETSKLAKSRDWKICCSYYTIYFSIYAILMEIGIKSEIHICTIEFAKKFLKKYLSKKDLKLFEMSFSARIDSQYYTNKEVSEEKYKLLIENTTDFFIKCKNIILTEKEIKEIRNKLNKQFKISYF